MCIAHVLLCVVSLLWWSVGVPVVVRGVAAQKIRFQQLPVNGELRRPVCVYYFTTYPVRVELGGKMSIPYNMSSSLPVVQLCQRLEDL